MRQVFLDTETTGLSTESGDRVIEIGCVEMIDRKLTGHNFHVYLNPGRDSHEEALKVHGLTTQFLQDKPVFQAVVDSFIGYIENADVFIHNASFDIGFLNAELALVGKLNFKSYVASVTDTLALAKDIFPGKRNSLDALCDRLEVDNSGRDLHGALLDSQLLADVYINLTRGQDVLLMDSEPSREGQLKMNHTDFSSLDLPVLQATEQDLTAHEKVLVEIDQASGGKTIWRQSI